MSQYTKSYTTLSNICLALLIIFSGFYITRLPISPIYITTAISVFGLVFLLLNKNIIVFPKTSRIALFIIGYYFVSQIFLDPNISTFTNFTFSLIVFVATQVLIQFVQINRIVNYIRYFYYFSIILLLIEFYIRITNPIYFVDFAERGRDDLFFYYYKVNSIMYPDSNYVALFSLSLIFFILYMKPFLIKIRLKILTLFFLLIGTLSRASIISFFVFITVYVFKDKIIKYKLQVSLVLVFILAILMMILPNLRLIDDSFSSKFSIFDQFFLYSQRINLTTLLFGVGFGNSYKVIGIGAHNIFITYIIESGIVGLILNIYFYIVTFIKSKGQIYIVFLPFLLSSQSLFSGATPYLFVIFASIIEIEKRMTSVNEESIYINTRI